MWDKNLLLGILVKNKELKVSFRYVIREFRYDFSIRYIYDRIMSWYWCVMNLGLSSEFW